MGKPVYTSKRTELDSEAKQGISLNGNRVEFFMRMFQDSKDISAMMPAALKLIADQFSFAKAYIFEMDQKNMVFNKTFSWDNEEALGHNEHLNHFMVEDFSQSIDVFLKSRIFVMNSLDDLANDGERELIKNAGINSMLIFSIIYKGESIGFVGFENYKKQQVFDANFIDELNTISNIISIFLLSYRFEKRLES